MIRLTPDHSGKITRASQVTFTFDGVPISARQGESAAVALMRAGQLALRGAPGQGSARGMFCCMGLCQECAVEMDGQAVESCRLTVTDGLSLGRLDRP